MLEMLEMLDLERHSVPKKIAQHGQFAQRAQIAQIAQNAQKDFWGGGLKMIFCAQLVQFGFLVFGPLEMLEIQRVWEFGGLKVKKLEKNISCVPSMLSRDHFG